ncbi:MAG: MBL fold metallo-hydrolase [Methanobacteriota archaeon]|nr:MAG: MBL fold metallo-hydrolase [Euryarchaeota archaeon]
MRWHGHACFEVAGSSVVVTDPHDGKSIGIRPPKVTADVVLVSHDHFDHNCPRAVKGLESTVIDEPVMTVEKGVRVEGVEAFHDEQRGTKRGRVTLFRFELDGLSFCHLGDLGHILDEVQAERLAGVDVLFVPVGDVFTVGPEGARRVVEQLGPRVAVPMHYRTLGLSLSIRPVQDFLEKVDSNRIVKVGNEVEFSSDDLAASGTDIWVFSE